MGSCVGKELWDSGVREFSLVSLFGMQMPIHPDVFSTLDKRVKWFGVFTEGDFCLECGCLTARDLVSHHKECSDYRTLSEIQRKIEDNNMARGTEAERETPLDIKIKDGKIVISIGIDTLARAATYHDGWEDSWNVTDSLELAKSVVSELHGLGDDVGLVAKSLDKALDSAFENGTLGIDFGE